MQVADCVPILLYNSKKKVIAAVHSGWRGTAKAILVKTIEMMINNYGCEPSSIIAGLGPSIGSCCYTVSSDVYDAFNSFTWKEKVFRSGADKLLKLDLWNANKELLLAAGILEKNIELSNLCTQCISGVFYSSRAGKGNTGRMAAGIMLID